MTPAMPPMASLSELVRTALRSSTAAVTEGSRRNARDEISARTSDTEAATRLLASLAPATTGVRRHSA